MQQSAVTEKNGKCSSSFLEAFMGMLHEFWKIKALFSQYFAIIRLIILGKTGVCGAALHPDQRAKNRNLQNEADAPKPNPAAEACSTFARLDEWMLTPVAVWWKWLHFH